MTVQLFDLPHRQARDLLERDVPVFLTVDPVEYHGPHLSLHNDRIMSAAMVRALHAGLARESGEDLPLLLADALPVGFEPVPGPGTRAVPFNLVRTLVTRACLALAELGARSIILVTGHGAPLHSVAIQHGVREVSKRGVRAVAPMNVIMRDLVQPPPAMLDEVVRHVPASERAALRASLERDFHAGFAETSLSLYWQPEAVDPIHRELPDIDLDRPDPAVASAARVARGLGRRQLADELEYAAYGVAWAKMRPFPGYTGRPRLACAAAGAVLAQFAEERMLQASLAVLHDGAPAPEPPLRWLELASLGGRIPGLAVPPEAVRAFR